ncbi:BQ2448_522 [Microbotryum intermedium]|uniref:BQ2448_522 protein n=1 Tax=Microbotryum intermedium TaxID=269621 RepID=A0A238F8H1_9BASI|nr:BQ2448_522 [Microbotryum intermedium]
MNFIRSFLNSWMPRPSEQDLAQAKSTVEDLISSSPIAVFSKSYCPYCNNAKSLLVNLGQKANTKAIELDRENNGVAIQRYLAERNNVSRVTVPQIYIKGQLIGGCSDLQSLHSSGKLEPLLKTH